MQNSTSGLASCSVCITLPKNKGCTLLLKRLQHVPSLEIFTKNSRLWCFKSMLLILKYIKCYEYSSQFRQRTDVVRLISFGDLRSEHETRTNTRIAPTCDWMINIVFVTKVSIKLTGVKGIHKVKFNYSPPKISSKPQQETITY